MLAIHWKHGGTPAEHARWLALFIISQNIRRAKPKDRRMGRRRIAMNIWGNWNGYRGRHKVAEFGCGIRGKNDAEEWLYEIVT